MPMGPRVSGFDGDASVRKSISDPCDTRWDGVYCEREGLRSIPTRKLTRSGVLFSVH